jgi:hypothetical protein
VEDALRPPHGGGQPVAAIVLGVGDEVRLVVGDDGDARAAGGETGEDPQRGGRGEVQDVGCEAVQQAPHARRHRRDGEPRVDQAGDPHHPHDGIPGMLRRSPPRGDDESLVAATAEVLQEGGDGAGDAVDLREEALGHDRHAHHRHGDPGAGPAWPRPRDHPAIAGRTTVIER